MSFLNKKNIPSIKKTTPPHYLIVFLVYILILIIFSSLMLTLRVRDSILYLLAIPPVIASFYYNRWIPIAMMVMLIGDGIWVTSIVSGDFDASLYSIGFAGSTVIAVTQGIYAFKVSKEALQLSEEKYRLLTELTKDVIIRLSPTGEVLFVSSAIKFMSGYEPEEEIGEYMSKYFALDEDIIRAEKLLAETLKTRKSGRFEFLFKAKDGKTFPVEYTYLPIVENDEVVFIQLVLRDITERKKMEETLRASEETMRVFLNATTDEFILINPSGSIVSINKSAAKAWDFGQDELLGKNIFSFFSPETKEPRKKKFEEVLANKKPLRWADENHGKHYDNSAFPILNEDGSLRYIAIFAHDITDRVLAETKLKESEERYRAIIQDQTEFIKRFLPDGTVTFVNNALEEYMKSRHRMNSFVNKNLFAYIPEKDKKDFQLWLKNVTPESPVYTRLHILHLSDGSENWEKWINRAIFNDNGELIEIQATGSDVTKEVESERALRKSEKKYRDLFEYIPIGLYRTSRQGEILNANQAALKMLGYANSDKLPNIIEFYLNPKDREEKLAILDKKKSAYTTEMQLRCRDKSIIWVQNTAQCVRDIEGKIQYYEGSLQDITERKKAEEQLRILSKVVETTGELIVITDTAGNVIYVNDSLVVSLAYDTSEEVIGISMFEFTDKAGINSLREEVFPALFSIGKWKGILPVKRKDKSIFPVQATCSIMRDDNDNPRYLVAILEDITERVQAEETLRRYAHIVSTTNDHMSFLDRNYIYQAVNKAYLQAHQKDSQEIVGHSVADLLGVEVFEKNIKNNLDRCLAGEEIHYQAWFDFPTLGRRYMSVSYYPFTDSRGEITGIVVNSHDDTERNQAVLALKNERDLANALEKAAATIPSTLNLDKVLDIILEEVMHIVPCDAANIMLINNQQVSIVRWRGYQRFGSEEFVSTFLYALSDVPNLQQMFEKKAPSIINDTASYSGWIDVPAQKWLRSCAAAPIIIQDKVIGFLNVDSATPDFFNATHPKYLQAFAHHAASAINNARLYEQAQDEIEARKKAEKELYLQASTDPLTKIFNRRYFFETAKKELERSQRYNRPLSIITFDIDFFKKVNDTYGHGAGDEVLRKLTAECKDSLRENDIFARYGGEEFVILLPETNLEQARQIAERMRKNCAGTPFDVGSATVKITVSFGVSSLCNENIPLDELLLRADKALYQAKETGRNRVCVWKKS